MRKAMTTKQERLPQGERIELQGPDNMVLKQLVLDDAQTYFDLIDYEREHLSQYEDDTANKYQTVDDVRQSIEKPNPYRLRFGIWVDDKMVGSINLDRTEMEYHGRDGVEVGYWIGAEHIGHGYASGALQILIPFAFEQSGVDRIYAQVATPNTASLKTLEKNGFKVDKRLTEDDYWRELELLKSAA